MNVFNFFLAKPASIDFEPEVEERVVDAPQQPVKRQRVVGGSYEPAYNENEMLDCLYALVVGKKSLNDALCTGRRPGRPGPVARSTLSKRGNEFAQSKGFDRLGSMPNSSRVEVTREQLRPFASANASGAQRYFTDDQEVALALLLQGVSMRGKSVPLDVALDLMWQCAAAWGVPLRKDTLSRHFIASFVGRHEALSISSGRVLDSTRRFAESHLRAFYLCMEGRLRDIDPRSVGNIDEAGCVVNGNSVKVVCASVSDVAHVGGEETLHPHITIAPFVVGNGELLVTQFIYEHQGDQFMTPHHEDDGNAYSSSRSGFMDSQIFSRFMRQLVGPAIVRHRAAHRLGDSEFFLLLDGHASHTSDKKLMVDMQQEFNVTVVFLPPHTSHKTQPLDRGFFHPFKMALRRSLARENFFFDRLNIADRTTLIKKALVDGAGFDGGNIRADFNRAGFCPWDPEKVINCVDIESPRFQRLENGEVICYFAGPLRLEGSLPPSDRLAGENSFTLCSDQVAIVSTKTYSVTPKGKRRVSKTIGQVIEGGQIKEALQAGIDVLLGVRDIAEANKRRQLPGVAFGCADSEEYQRRQKAIHVTQWIRGANRRQICDLCAHMGLPTTRTAAVEGKRMAFTMKELSTKLLEESTANLDLYVQSIALVAPKEDAPPE